MTLEELMQDERSEGFEEGKAEGLAEGLEKGRSEGLAKALAVIGISEEEYQKMLKAKSKEKTEEDK